MAQTFFPITPVEVTPDTAADWIGVDAGDFGVPGDATGVIVHAVNISGSDRNVGLRMNGSTDNRKTDLHKWTHCWAAIGVDGNRIFDVYVEDKDDIDIYLVGYTMAGVTFFTNAVNKVFTGGAWTGIDCSIQAPDAIGLIFEPLPNTTNVIAFGMRKNGSTDDRKNLIEGHSCFSVIIGCDGSQICDGYRPWYPYLTVYLNGYITDGCTFNTNATDVSLDTEKAWTDLEALPEDSCRGFFEVIIPSGFSATYGLRKNGSAENIHLWPYQHNWGFVECDGSYIVEGWVEDNGIDFFVVGYATAAPGEQYILPTSIVSAEAFGTAKVNLKVSPSAISSLEAFGTAKLNQRIFADAISSLEAFGTAKLNLKVSPSAISSLESFGTAKLNQRIFADSIASLEAFGTAKVNQRLFIIAIPSEEAFGDALVILVKRIAQAIRDELLATLGLTALVGERIYYVKAPQDVETPYVVFFKVSAPREHAHDGASLLAMTRFQFSIFTPLYQEAKQIAEQIQSVLQAFSGTIGGLGGVSVGGSFHQNEIDFWEENTRLYHVACDYTIWHQE